MRRPLGIGQQCVAVCTVTFAPCCTLLATGCGSKSMPPPPPVLSVLLMPVRGGAVTGQSVTFTATVQNDVGAAGVTWSASGGSLTTQSTTAATLMAPNTTGDGTVTATSLADAPKNATPTITGPDLPGVRPLHNDMSRRRTNTH